MKKSILILIIIGICMGGVMGVPTYDQPITQNSLTASQGNPIVPNCAVISNAKSNKAINIVTSIENCPKTAHKGQYVTLKLVIINKGTKPIYDVVIYDQGIQKNNWNS
jgi:hypothetical protein